MNRALVEFILNLRYGFVHRRRGNSIHHGKSVNSPWSARRVDRERGIETCWGAMAAPPADCSLVMAMNGNCDRVKPGCRESRDNRHS